VASSSSSVGTQLAAMGAIGAMSIAPLPIVRTIDEAGKASLLGLLIAKERIKLSRASSFDEERRRMMQEEAAFRREDMRRAEDEYRRRTEQLQRERAELEARFGKAREDFRLRQGEEHYGARDKNDSRD
jgi:hypothetical protein